MVRRWGYGEVGSLRQLHKLQYEVITERKLLWRVWKGYGMTAIKELPLQLACRLGKTNRFREGYCKSLERQKSNKCKSSLT